MIFVGLDTVHYFTIISFGKEHFQKIVKTEIPFTQDASYKVCLNVCDHSDSQSTKLTLAFGTPKVFTMLYLIFTFKNMYK